MLKISASLWSADLTNLETEIKRLEAYIDRFHIDVADGRYVDLMLFFPDMVAAMRPHTSLPFEVHLITLSPRRWVKPFADAGADTIIFYHDAAEDPQAVIDLIREHGCNVGVSLRVEDDLDVVEPYWDGLDVLTLVTTHMGVKGVDDIAPNIPDKIERARREITERGLRCEIEVDGAIRRHTVPRIHAAGADLIVPGSLLFKENPVEIREWLASLDG